MSGWFFLLGANAAALPAQWAPTRRAIGASAGITLIPLIAAAGAAGNDLGRKLLKTA